MRRTTRVAVVGCAGALALAVAGQAFAAYAPKITAWTSGVTTTIAFVAPSTDDPTLQLQFLVPSGFTANLGSAGQTIGTVDAKTAAADLGGATLPLTGTLQVRSAAGTYGANVPLAAAATVCTGTASHMAFWVLVLSAAGQTLEVPVFVDPGPSGGPAYILTICLPPPDIPAGNPARAAFGAKLFDAALKLNGVFTAPAGEKRWKLIATPYTPGTGTPNRAGTVETQSLDRGPANASLTAKKTATRKRASIVAAFFTSGTPSPIGGATVQILAGKRVIASGKTNSGGQFRAIVKLPTFAATLTAKISAPARDLGASACLATQPPIPCIGATLAGFSATSKAVRVKT